MGNCLILASSPSLSSSSSSSCSCSSPRSNSMLSASSYDSCAAAAPARIPAEHRAAPPRILPFSTPSDLHSHYQLEGELGRGQYGVIRLCTCRSSGTRFACKSISKLRAEYLHDILREVRIMQRLSLPSPARPNDIVRLHQVIEDASHVHLIMELCQGGELFDRIVKKNRYPEPQAACVMKSLMKSIEFCHRMGVMHRDLKPENILLVDSSDSSPIKLADFGLALEFSPGEKFTGMAGSSYYIAPEVLQGEYSEEIDVWSAGVVLYVMLSGLPPFWGETDQNIFDAIREGKLEFTSNPWCSISFSAKDLIRRMLCADVKARLTPAQVLEHPWIRHHTKEPEQASQQHCKNITSNSKGNKHTMDTQEDLTMHRPSSASPTPLCIYDDEQDTAMKVVAVCTPSSTSPVVLSEDNEQKSLVPTLTFSNASNPALQVSHSDDRFKTNMDALAVALIAKLDVKHLPKTHNLKDLSAEGGWSCALLGVSPNEKIFAIEVGKKSYLVSYNRRRKVGWKILGRHYEGTCSPSLHVNMQGQAVVH